MVAGVRTNYLRLVAQSYATLDQRLLQILDVLQVVVGHSFVAQRPQPFCGLEFGRGRWQKLQLYPFGNFNLLARVPSGLIEHKKDTSLARGSDFLGEVL